MLWADPIDQDEGVCDGIYRYNEVRGCSYFFGFLFNFFVLNLFLFFLFKLKT